MNDSIVIAIDGPAGSGKSSTARSVASKLGLRYLDTGALYRAMTWWMLEHHVDVDDADAVALQCSTPRIESSTDPVAPTVSVDGVDVSEAIREPRIAQAVSAVSRVPQVRRLLVDLQQEAIGSGGVVVEGRDIGTVVAPTAQLKIFLTASQDARAQRRSRDLGRSEDQVAVTREAMQRRDLLDSTRATSPLTKADDAIEMDTTALTLDDVVQAVIQQAEARS